MYFSCTAIHIGISFDPVSYKAIFWGFSCETEQDNATFFLGPGEGESGYHYKRGILSSLFILTICSKISMEFSVLRISLKDLKMTPRVVQGIMLNKVAIFFVGTKYVSSPCSGSSCNQHFKFSTTLVK